jgi:hypothetical protein
MQNIRKIKAGLNSSKDGVYENNHAIFFVKGDKVIMKLKGQSGYYKTNSNFMIGVKFSKELTEGMNNSFEKAYNAAENW